MGKYDTLERFLKLHRENKVTLTLEQIELIMRSRLRKSARKYTSFWLDPSSSSAAESVSRAGWAARPRMVDGKVNYLILRKITKSSDAAC